MAYNTNLLKHKTILIIGDIILDEYVFGNVKRISPEAPVPILDVEIIEQRPGGAANVALNCKALGCNVDIVSVSGKDINGINLIKQLENKNINCFIEQNEDYNTIKKTRLISNFQQIIRIDEEKKTPQITNKTNSIFLNRLEKADVVVFSDYGKGVLNNLPNLINKAKLSKKLCLVDPKGMDPSKFKGCDILTPNTKEMIGLIGDYQDDNDLKEKTFKMMEKNKINNIVLTRGEKGITLYQLYDYLEFNIKGTSREVFDVTGAGDTVISVLSALLSINYSIKDACIIANKAGGVVVQKFGTSSITLEEIL